MPNKSNLIGRTIVGISLLPKDLAGELYWFTERPPVVLHLDDGSLLLPARDDELNGPGTLILVTEVDQVRSMFTINPS